MSDDIQHLLEKYFRGDFMSDYELDRMREWVESSPHNQEAMKLLEDKYFLQAAVNKRKEYAADRDGAWNKLTRQINNEPEVAMYRRLPFYRQVKWRYAAAVIVLMSGFAAYFAVSKKEPAAMVAADVETLPKDVPAPSASRATLTLANGETIFLDSAMNGSIAHQRKVNIQKMNGQIIYRGPADRGEIAYNTLSVPRGSQIAQLILSDGTKVFLNAASSLRYPVAFTGSERRVEITGEAYFEVTKDPHRKFVVQSNGITTEVLGTHFNVNSYPDEESEKVTLAEGSVKVVGKNESMVIKPGEQVQASPSAKLRINKNVNVAQVTAWQKGLFVFTDMTLPAILRQVSRWYNVAVKYEGVIPETSYGGGLSRNLPLSETLRLLELGNVKFTMQGNTLIAQPK